jgi:metal-responsive CopG/Arc/MetJ family transcriptional regulator
VGKTASTTRKRVNISLTRDTLRLLDRVAAKGDRSQLIDLAVRRYISTRSRRALRELLKEGARARAQRDLDLAEEGFAVDSAPWPSRKRRK